MTVGATGAPEGGAAGADGIEEVLRAFEGVRVDHDNLAWYRGLLARRLLVNRCDDCGRRHHPPRPVCPGCWSRSITATEVAGAGFVALCTVLRQGPAAPGVDYAQGHALVAVELDEQPGLRLASTVVGTPAAQVRLGDRVRVVWRDVPGRPPTPEFEVVR